MKRKCVLVPHAIAEKCTLWEALHWVAFNIYPLQEYTDNKCDRREDLEYIEDPYFRNPIEIESFFTKDICDKYQLPKSAVAEYIKEYGESPYFGDFSEEFISELLKDEKIDEKMSKDLFFNAQMRKEFEKEEDTFTEAKLDFLEIHKAELFAAIKKGLVKTYGRNLLKGVDLSQYDFSDGVEIYDLWGSGVEQPLEEMSAQVWHANSLHWEECQLINGTKSVFCHILVDVESLFLHFPEPSPQMKSIMSVNGVLIDYEGDHGLGIIKANNTGRPPYDWKSFQAEMASRLLKNTLPRLQKTCVIEMQEWCMSKWGKTPSETNLKNNISPFYTALKKSETK